MNDSAPRPAKGHIPFKGHRTIEEVRQDEYRTEILLSLGGEQKRERLSIGQKVSRRG